MTDEHQQPQGGPEGLSEDPIVERLVPDPSQPPLPPPVVLAGLLGRSVREGHWRLYFSSTLESYAEFKEEDVINSVKIPQEQPPFAGLEATRVWLRRDAEIEYTRAESRRMQAEFLSGGLAAGFRGVGGGLGAAQMLGGGVGGTWGASQPPMCNSAVDLCPSVWGCQQTLSMALCPPQQTFAFACDSIIDMCPPRPVSMQAFACGSMVDNCPSSLGCGGITSPGKCDVAI